MQDQRLNTSEKNKVSLIVGFPFNPSARITPEEVLPALVIDEDGEREGKGRQPPVEVERVHPQPLVHARGVGQEGGQHGLEDQTKVHEPVLHTLLEHGVLPGLTDDEISPLDNDNRDKEGGMAGIFQNLPVLVGPLLAVGVLEVVDGNRIPRPTETKKLAGPEPVLAHDHKVDEETGRGLDHTNLTIGHGDQTLVDEFVGKGVSGLTLHDVGLSLLISHGDGRHHVSSQVNAEDGHGTEG